MIAPFPQPPAQAGRPVADTPSTDGRPGGGSRELAILLVDDDPAVARAMEIAFRLAGHRLDVASDPEQAHSRLARSRYDAVLLDLNFTSGKASGEEGMACLRRIMADHPLARVVVITAHSGIRIAVTAMQAGARDFIMKPWRNADLIAKVGAVASHEGERPVLPPGEPVGNAPPVLLGESAVMRRLRELIRRVAPTPAGVTITGRPGSGRTLAARVLHAASRDSDIPFALIDLRSMEDRALVGEVAGTVLLRHPDRLDRVAQDRLADTLPRAARAIAIADGVEPLTPALRRRIATVEVAVPPLVEREDDAVLLARHFVAVAADRFGRDVPTLTPAAEDAVREGPWLDEVRGLELAIERAVLLADGVIDAQALGLDASAAIPADPARETSFDLSDAERAMIVAALREHRHNVTHAAVALGLSRGALYRRMARYGL